MLSKDIKPAIAELPPQHTKIMTIAQLELAAIALLPSKTTEEVEKRFARLDAISDEMNVYEHQLSTIQDNVDAVIAMEPQAKQTKAACDDLIAKLPTMFAVQATTAAAFGFVPVPDPEDYSRMDSNLRYLSASIRIVFEDAHAAQTVVDKTAREASSFRAVLSRIWWDEFGAQFNAMMKEQAAASAAKPQPPPAPKRATASAKPQGPQLLPTPGPVQREQNWEPLPGAPGPSPYREVETKKDTFAKDARDLIAIGNRVLSSSSNTVQAEQFKTQERNWRTKVEAWLTHYRTKGPDTGVRAMDELLNSDEVRRQAQTDSSYVR